MNIERKNKEGEQRIENLKDKGEEKPNLKNGKEFAKRHHAKFPNDINSLFQVINDMKEPINFSKEDARLVEGLQPTRISDITSDGHF